MNFRKTSRDVKMKVKFPQPVRHTEPRQWITPPGNIPADVNRIVNIQLREQMDRLMPIIRDLALHDPALAGVYGAQIEQAVRNMLTGNPGDGSLEMASITQRITEGLNRLLSSLIEGLNTMMAPIADIMGTFAQTVAQMFEPIVGFRQHPARIPTGSEVNQNRTPIYYVEFQKRVEASIPEIKWDEHNQKGSVMYRGKIFWIEYLFVQDSSQYGYYLKCDDISIKATDFTQIRVILDHCCAILGDTMVQLPNDWKVLL